MAQATKENEPQGTEESVKNIPRRICTELYCVNMETDLKKKKEKKRQSQSENCEKEIPLHNSIVSSRVITCPDGLSNVYQSAPVWPSFSTETVAEPRTVLFHIISQS